MAAGDRWRLVDGREAVEMPGSTPNLLRLAVVVPWWPWPNAPTYVERAGCTLMTSRYLHGAIPGARQ